MSSKHPGRQTEYAKFKSVMQKLQNRLNADEAEKNERLRKTRKEKK